MSQTDKESADNQITENVSTDTKNSIQTTDQTANSNHSNDLEQNNHTNDAVVNKAKIS